MAGLYTEGESKILSGVYSLILAISTSITSGGRGIVQSGFRADEKRSGYTRQMQRFGKCAFKVVFYFFDSHFSLADRKWRMVILRYLQIVHDVLPFLLLTMSSLVN